MDKVAAGGGVGENTLRGVGFSILVSPFLFSGITEAVLATSGGVAEAADGFDGATAACGVSSNEGTEDDTCAGAGEDVE